jgi:hypothetical protein
MSDATPADPVTAAAEAIMAEYRDLDGNPRARWSRDLAIIALDAAESLIADRERDRILCEDPAAGVYRLGCRDGAKAERERLAAVISAGQFRKLADWFDTDDEFKEAMFPETWSPGSRKDDVQQDLRRFADLLGGETP